MSRPPHLFLQIVDDSGVVAKLPAGGSLELDLITHFSEAILEELDRAGVSHATQVDHLVEPILRKGVGFFKTQAKVERAIRNGLLEATSSTKSNLSIERAIKNALEGAIKSLKDKTIYVV